MSNEKKAPGRFWRGGREGYHREAAFHAPDAPPALHAVTPRVVPPLERSKPPYVSPEHTHDSKEKTTGLFEIIPRTVPHPARRVTLASKCHNCGKMFSFEADRMNESGLYEFREGADKCTDCGTEAEEVWSMSPERLRRKREDTKESFPTGAPPAREPLEPMSPSLDEETDL